MSTLHRARCTWMRGDMQRYGNQGGDSPISPFSGAPMAFTIPLLDLGSVFHPVAESSLVWMHVKAERVVVECGGLSHPGAGVATMV